MDGPIYQCTTHLTVPRKYLFSFLPLKHFLCLCVNWVLLVYSLYCSLLLCPLTNLDVSYKVIPSLPSPRIRSSSYPNVGSRPRFESERPWDRREAARRVLPAGSLPQLGERSCSVFQRQGSICRGEVRQCACLCRVNVRRARKPVRAPTVGPASKVAQSDYVRFVK